MEANNAAKMREAVKELLDAMYDMGIDEETVSTAAESPNCHMHSVELLSVIKKAKAALAAPPRNCDVGTAAEQERRFKEFCAAHWNINNVDSECAGCPLTIEGAECEFAWAQMPYKEGGAK